jgi:hypothetical protein
MEQASTPHIPPMTSAAQKGEGPSLKIPHRGKGDQTLGDRRWGGKNVCCHKGSAKGVPLGRQGWSLEEVKARRENVVGKPIHFDDCCHDPPSPVICAEVQAWVMEDLMAMVNEEGRGHCQQPPISIVGRGGVVNVTDGSWGAWKGYNPQNHGGSCSGNHRNVGSRKVHGWEMQNDKGALIEGRRQQEGSTSTTLVGGRIQTTTWRHENVDKGEAIFFYTCTPCKRNEAGTMPSAIMGAAFPWFTGEGSKTY